ncbi:cytidine deaminase [Lacticaseibacillus parakribbianus]|uniref:cytidine deaminase n=1 Tax=Lacticaseibacillus parakribbianus TaxID=2970927 RepID=UPI0021CB81DA|nr:cytidine deaminase [Lacticaseibacillus parakribbianus]
MPDLIAAAIAQRDLAYVPYSHFKVGAAVLANGRVFTGCNIENASYGLAMCAERNALFAAVAAGCTEVTAIAVVADTAGPVSPCGACRQVMAEFMAPDAAVTLANLAGATQETTVAELLPGAFLKGDLNA